MGNDRRIHALLPWYVNGTLEAEESERFEAHLASCRGCKDEMAILEDVRAQVAEHGADYLADHPEPEALVALADGALPEEQTQRVRRHVALCGTCALEMRWINGELQAAGGAQESRRAGSSPWRSPWWAAAAALLAVGLAVSLLWQRPADPAGAVAAPSGVHRTHFLRGVERAAEGPQSFAAPPEGEPLRLLIEADFPPEAFPLERTITRADGGVVLSEAGIGADKLIEELYLYVECAAADCPPGASYTATLTPADTSIEPLRFPFAVEPR